ncbi:MAG: hypothetical protein HGA72_00280 [Chlorobiaceae bacterium]|nr:hypothetical protein [Chlorobiaceae bacterium]
MTEHNLTEELAGLLRIEPADARRLLGSLSGAMSAGLLQDGRLQVSGLGMFTVHHDPAMRQMHGSDAIYSPPHNKVVFIQDVSAKDGTIRIASQRMNLDRSESEQFTRALATLFAALVASGSPIDLQGFGILSKSEGANYTFQAAKGLDELLNSEYQGLQEISLSPDNPRSPDEKNKAVPGTKSRSNVMRMALSALLAVSALLALVIVVPAIRNGSLFNSGTAPASLSPPFRQAATLSPADSFLSEGASGDSRADDKVIVLEKGEFTIVLATFRTAKVALGELAKLKESGLKVFIWPVSDKGKKYYRLALGRYGSRNEAGAGGARRRPGSRTTPP